MAGVTLSAPQPRFAWQVWYFRYLSLDLRGRRGAFGAAIDVSGSSATREDRFGAAGSCVAGVTLSAPQPRFAWQAWYFRCLPYRCPRKLREDLRGRRGTFGTSIHVRGSSRTLVQKCYKESVAPIAFTLNIQ